MTRVRECGVPEGVGIGPGVCFWCSVPIARPQVDEWCRVLCENCSGTKKLLQESSQSHKRGGAYRIDDDPNGYQVNAYRELEDCRDY